MNSIYRSTKYKKITPRDIFIGREIKKLRNIYPREDGSRGKITASELAELIGYQQPTIANFENGNKSIPDELLPKLEEIFKLPKDYFDKTYDSSQFKVEEESNLDYLNNTFKNRALKNIESCLENIELGHADKVKDELVKIKEDIESIK